MNLRRSIKLFTLILVGTMLVSSCCDNDCFDDLTGSLEVKLFFSGTDTINHFNPRRLDLLDSLYLIKTTKGNLNDHLDTIYNFEREYFTRTHLFLLNSDVGFDYIIGNRDPKLRAEIVDFHSEVEDGSGKCGCKSPKSLRATVDSTEYRGVNVSPVWVYRIP